MVGHGTGTCGLSGDCGGPPRQQRRRRNDPGRQPADLVARGGSAGRIDGRAGGSAPGPACGCAAPGRGRLLGRRLYGPACRRCTARAAAPAGFLHGPSGRWRVPAAAGSHGAYAAGTAAGGCIPTAAAVHGGGGSVARDQRRARRVSAGTGHRAGLRARAAAGAAATGVRCAGRWRYGGAACDQWRGAGGADTGCDAAAAGGRGSL